MVRERRLEIKNKEEEHKHFSNFIGLIYLFIIRTHMKTSRKIYDP